MAKAFIVVVYDISNDRRRTKLHKALCDYGDPVQYSVFECLVDAEQLARMKKTVNRIIRPRTDRVRYYTLCRSCQKKIEVTSGAEVVSEEQVIVV